MAGDAETGVTIIKLVEELDAGPIAAQQSFAIDPNDDAGAVFAKAAEIAASPSRRCALADPCPCCGNRTANRRTRPRSRRTDRRLDLDRPVPRARRSRARALAAHRRTRRAARTRRHDLAGSRRRRRLLRAGRGAARGRPPHDATRHGFAVCDSKPGTRRGVRRPRAGVRGRGVRGSRVSYRWQPTSTSAIERSPSGSPSVRSSACARSTTRSRSSADAAFTVSTRLCELRSVSVRTSSGSSTASRATPP